MASADRRVAQGLSEEALADAGRSDQQDVLVLVQKLQGEDGIQQPTRIASNQMLLNFGRTRSLGGSSHGIRHTWPAPVGRSTATHRRTRFGHPSSGVLRLIDTRVGSCKGDYVNPSTRGSPRMPKERRARSLTVSAISLTFKVDTARRQRMLRTESSQDGRTKIARAQPRIRDGERTSSTLTDATSPSPTPSATRALPAPNMPEAAA